MVEGFEQDMGLPETEAIWGNFLHPEDLKRLMNTSQNNDPNKKFKAGHGAPFQNHNQAQKMSQWMQTMTKMILRHEDSLNLMQSDCQFLLHTGFHADGVIPILLKNSTTWNAQDPQSRTEPLRQLLARTMMETMLDRLKRLHQADEKSDLLQQCLKSHLILEDKTMPYLMWDPKNKTLIPSRTKALPIQEVMQDLTQMVAILAQHQVVLRFHSLRKIDQLLTKHTQNAVPWLWTISLRGEGAKLIELVQKYAFHSSWQLICTRIKMQTQARSQMAKDLAKHLPRNSASGS